jgi:membrane-associated protease RseP (regulator of RpoE activity)
MLVAIPVLLYGLSLSPVTAVNGPVQQEGNSILYALAKLALKGEWLPSGARDVALHPTAWAGWAGLLVTMINLLPVGQLDGGHVATAYFGNRYHWFARAVHRFLPVMALSVFAWVMNASRGEMGARWDWRIGGGLAAKAAMFWLVWYFFLTILGRLSGGELAHPPVDDRPLPRSRRLLFWLVVLVFVAIFMPVPLREILRAGPP